MRARVTSLIVVVCAMAAVASTPGAAAAQPAPSAGAERGVAAPAKAQPDAASDIPPPEEIEPAVDTTHTAAQPAASLAAPAPAATPTPVGTATSASATASEAAGASAREPAARAHAAGSRKHTSARDAASRRPDRLQLDTTDITGNRELPKVLSIVPWKHSDLGDLAGRPANSLLDEVLQPLDRDVFRRENRYYEALKPDQQGSKADQPAPSGAQP